MGSGKGRNSFLSKLVEEQEVVTISAELTALPMQLKKEKSKSRIKWDMDKQSSIYRWGSQGRGLTQDAEKKGSL